MTKLSRETVIRAALDLLNEVGVDGLSTRRLAERLGVQQPALYWHFKNKRELRGCAFPAMLVERHTRGIPQPGEHAARVLHDNAMSFRRGLLAIATVPAFTRARGQTGRRPARWSAAAPAAGRRVRAGRQRACAAGGQPVRWARCWSSRRRRTARGRA